MQAAATRTATVFLEVGKKRQNKTRRHFYLILVCFLLLVSARLSSFIYRVWMVVAVAIRESPFVPNGCTVYVETNKKAVRRIAQLRKAKKTHASTEID